MKEKTKGKLKKIGKGIVTRVLFYSMFNWSLPVLVPAALLFYTPSRRVEQQVIEKYKNLPRDFTAVDYLNFSNMLVHHEGKGAGVCKDYAIGTFDVYKNLIKNDNRDDLEDKIKIAAGNYGGQFLNIGHMWIKVKDRGRWLNYESTEFVSLLSADELKLLSDHILKYKQELPSKDIPLVEMLETFEGKKVFRPKVEAFKNGGIVGACYHKLKSCKIIEAVWNKLTSDEK